MYLVDVPEHLQVDSFEESAQATGVGKGSETDNLEKSTIALEDAGLAQPRDSDNHRIDYCLDQLDWVVTTAPLSEADVFLQVPFEFQSLAEALN